MKKVNLLAAAVVAASFMAPAANAALNADTALKGDCSYFRAAVFSKHFDSNPNDVGRLGNENDTYIELSPGVTLAEVDNTQWDFRTSFAMQSRKQGAWQDTNGDLTFANTQAFLRVSGMLDFDPDAVIWVGKKYIRSNSDLTDQYWRNTSGNGVGIENLSLGAGKFRANWTRRDSTATFDSTLNNDAKFKYSTYKVVTDANEAYDTKVTQKFGDYTYETKLKKSGVSDAISPSDISTNLFDVDYGFAPVDGTWLDFGYTLITPQRYSSEYASYGYKLARDLSNGHILTLGFGEALLGGWNNTVVRYISGSTAFSGFGDGTWLQSNASSSTYTWDFLNNGNVRCTDNFLMYYHIRGTINGGYDKQLTSLEKSKAFQLVVRPELQLTKMTKVAAEFGMYTKSDSYTDAKDNTNAQQQKATLAYVLCPDASAFYHRPEIRFFVTYKHAGHNAGEYASFKKSYSHVVTDAAGNLETVSYGRDRNNVTVFGVQAEAWF